ncbi:MAG: LlaJI family restriction endonuclease [Paludibacteraceae bacterium]|nr:LlaJI family restriction endonuclease [Paludibacteraceae bacterium]
MRILIEEHIYEATEEILQVVSELGPTQSIKGQVSINYVGYYYNSSIHDCVFILPKVLVDESGKAFGKHDPAKIVHLENKENTLDDNERKFIYELAVWIYRAINVFKEQNPESPIVLHKQIALIGHGERQLSNTFLDILLSLIQFNKENQNFFFFIIKNLHRGHNKISWNKTISHSQAFLQEGTPLYLNPVNKRHQVNFDEELMVIYFSIMNHIHKEYGFPFEFEYHYELINDQQFKNYLNGQGKRRLREIKYKYFSDKALELWELCYTFFEKASQIMANTQQKEYLLVKNFNIVFEDIIDELLGGRNDELPTELQEQADGKRVDHLYRYKSLIEAENDNIYYIGDSKYYKRNTQIGKEALYKQFTYARNVIQWNLDLFLDEGKKYEQEKEKRKGTNILRDELTEGYNIIPNFFISAQQKDLEKDDNITWVDKDNKEFASRQFENRLFDRDTLLVCHYDVNFLYVVSLYGRKNEGEKSSWREKVKKQFRQEIINHIESRFDFSILEPKKEDLKKLVEKYFRKLNGKIFQPNDASNIVILALDKDIKFQFENLQLISQIEEDFHIYDYHLGNNPENLLYKYWGTPTFAATKSDNTEESEHPKGEPIEYKKQHKTSILFGIFKDEAHRNWILSEKRYNVRLGERAGAVKRTQQVTSAEYLVLYELNNETNFSVYRLNDRHHIWDTQKMKENNYPTEDYSTGKSQYYVYEITNQTDELGDFDIQKTLKSKRKEFQKETGMEMAKGTPIYVYANELERESF